MNKLLLSELKRKIDIRTSLLALPSVDDLLGLLGKTSPDEIRLEMYEIALEKWHYQVPLIRLMDVYLPGGPYRFTSNWKDVVENTDPTVDIPLRLIPTRVWSVGNLMTVPRNWVYQDDILYSYINGDYTINATFRRPLYYEFEGAENKLSSKSCIGGIEDRHISKFVDACLLETLNFISQLKKNFEYPDMPVQMFNGLDEAIQDLRSTLEIFYQGLTHGLIYGSIYG